VNRAFGGNTSYAPGPLNTSEKVAEGQLDLGYARWRLRSGYKWREAGVGTGASYALDPVGKERTKHFNADLNWVDAQFTQNLGLEFTASYLKHIEDMSYQMYPPGTTLPTGTFTNGMLGMPGRWERQYRMSGGATYTGFIDHSIHLGLGHDDLDLYQVRTVKNFLLNAAGVPIPTGPLIDYSTIQPHQLPHRRLNDYVYAQDEWKFARDWVLTAGIRNDHFSDFAAPPTARRAWYGRGIRPHRKAALWPSVPRTFIQ